MRRIDALAWPLWLAVFGWITYATGDGAMLAVAVVGYPCLRLILWGMT